MAWSDAGLHAFFDVTDASVQTVNMADATQALTKSYQGDSIEIYITSNNTLTGLTGTDTTSLQVVVPANGPAVSVKTDSSGGGTPTALPAGQFKQSKTSGGYAIVGGGYHNQAAGLEATIGGGTGKAIVPAQFDAAEIS